MQSKSPVLKAAWDKFHASMESAREAIEATPRFDNPAHRAQAYYALMEAQAMAYNWIVAPRLNHPRIFSHTAWATYLYTIAGNCPDFIYSIVPIDGKHTYRIKGRHGDVRLCLMQVFNRPMGSEGSKCTGNYEYAKTDNGKDDFEVILSAEKPKGNAVNWIPIDPASDFNMIVMRRLMLDWEDDPGEIEMEMIGEIEGYDELSEAAVARRISMAADFNLAVIKSWAIGFHDFVLSLPGSRYNVWANIPGQMMAAIAGSATCNYAFLPYDIKPDEAAIIELEEPKGSAYWSFQIVDVWSKSLDYMHAQTDINMKGASIDGDGKVRAVICFDDPGVANWLNPIRRPQGILALRNYRSKSFTAPTVKIVKTSELKKHLPADTKWVTPEQRNQAVARRRPAILKLYKS